MSPKTRSLAAPRNPIGVLVLLAAFAAAAGCSTAETTGGAGTNMNHVLPSGGSVPGWLVPYSGGTHASTAALDYIAGGGSSGCTECHGSDLAGGISGASCFSGTAAGCHHVTAPGDPVWGDPEAHGAAAKKAPGSSGFASCQICHGHDFSGGGAGESCFGFDCHKGAPHPSSWLGVPYAHMSTDRANAPVCAQCHYPGSPNNLPGYPDTLPPAGTAPDCFNNTLCHGVGNTPHTVPYNYTSHYTVTSATYSGFCSGCHDIAAPSTNYGPPCRTCHVAASPLAAAGCTSCHANPPDGPPTAYPNAAGAHAKHIALKSAGTPISCDTCHDGLGTGTLNHYNAAKSLVPPGNVAFLATYYAKTGASLFDNGAALSCTNVSCHGGLARSGGTPGTPLNWRTGALDVNTECKSCHTLGTAQYNSYNSGEHDEHTVEKGVICVYCHNTAALAVNHFTTLGDNTMSPADAAATIGGAGTLISTWTPGTGTSGTCTTSCHPGTRSW